jgi:gamma-polyglutamate biosynthesis protein CapA
MTQKNLIKLTIIGDVFPGELPYTQNYGIRTQFRNHKGEAWGNKIKEILGENDIVIGNLESPLIDERIALKKTFFGDPEFAKFLKDCGITVLNVANNHILEHGKSGFQCTIDTLKNAKLGIIGNIRNLDSNVYYRNIKRMEIAIAGFSNVDLDYSHNDYQFAVLNEVNVINSIKEMEGHGANLKILCFHWGNEYINVPSMDQRKMAYKFIDNGADIIIGHHPHVIQPYERYNNGHIFYSLGNFIFDFIHSKMVSIGLVATISITENKVINVRFKGVKLSNRNVIGLYPKKEFEKHNSIIISLYEKMKKQADEDYRDQYKNMLIRNHLIQRGLMKTTIIREFFRLNNPNKILLIRNLFNHYFKSVAN